jgi:hypothetical protein
LPELLLRRLILLGLRPQGILVRARERAHRDLAVVVVGHNFSVNTKDFGPRAVQLDGIAPEARTGQQLAVRARIGRQIRVDGTGQLLSAQTTVAIRVSQSGAGLDVVPGTFP